MLYHHRLYSYGISFERPTPSNANAACSNIHTIFLELLSAQCGLPLKWMCLLSRIIVLLPDLYGLV
jgi:hypothetical protein